MAEVPNEWRQGVAGGEEPFQEMPVSGSPVVAVTLTGQVRHR